MSGLFDFVKTVGRKLFGQGDDPAAKIKEMIEKDNPGIRNLGVSFKDGVVQLSGEGSTEAMQKAVLMAGNVQQVGEVKVEGQQAALDDGTQYYIIKAGDTLSAIAKQFYGDASKYPGSSTPIARSSRTPT
jgi:hypothetical protein